MSHRRLGRVPALDGVRALAAALVIARHAWSVPGGGGLGVDVFFVLSGFLITCLLLDEHEAHGRISLRAFYARRALRILPAFYLLLLVLVALTATGLLAQADPVGYRFTLGGALVSGGYLANLQEGLHLGWLPVVPADLRHTWSLAEEEQFYLVWPLLLMLMLRAGAGAQRLAAVLLLVALASTLDQLTLWHHGAIADRIWFSPDTHLAPIAVGALAGVVFSRRLLPDRIAGLLAPVAVLVCVGVVTLTPFDDFYLYDGPFALFPFACAIAVLAIATNAAGWLTRPFELGAMRTVGKISYGLYLWQLPLLDHLAPAVAVPASFVAAFASFHLFERRFLRLKDRFEPRPREDRDRGVFAEGRRGVYARCRAGVGTAGSAIRRPNFSSRSAYSK